jgi:pyruvate/2-oxoglutarate dehydrogenase complex dihydrolipoamide dehydrogenase (E3) component
MKTRDLVIIGGGPGGLVVASVAARLGLTVTLIEKEARLGGDCLHSGCVPSKTFIHAARVAALMRRGGEFGLPACAPEVDLGRVNDHVQSVIAHIQAHDDPERFRSYGCEVLLGEAASFISPYEVQVGGQVVRGKRFVIATGSHAWLPPLEGLEEAGCLTHRDVFALRTLPARLAVLGAGPIGLELAQAFARLGSQVTVIERLPQLLLREDPELTDLLKARLIAEGLRIHTATRALRVSRQGDARMVECEGGLHCEADALLVAVGRRPNVAGLNLAAAGVDCGAMAIQVDRRLRTTQKHIYACGDVCGPYPFTHMAEYQAGIVLGNAVFRIPRRADYRVVPWVTFTDPEFARVGLTETEAREQGSEPEVLRFPFRDVDRALTEGEPHGMVKLVARKGRLLGASILGPHAGELIHELVLAMKTGASLRAISATIHAYPTLAQAARRAVNTGFAKQLFSPRTRGLVRWLHRLLP